MKVILLQDVARIGRQFEIKDVPTGHALNMLIPKGIAEQATAENVRRIEAHAEKIQIERAASEIAFADALLKLKDTTVTIEVDTNEQGHMFQALKADVVLKAFKLKGIEFDESQIVMRDAIKGVGEYVIELHGGDKKEIVKITVSPKKP